VAVVFRLVPRRQVHSNTRIYAELPLLALAYVLVALDRLLVEAIPELHVVAAFGICLVALLTLLKLTPVRGPIELPD
jgi:hypothetical protein